MQFMQSAGRFFKRTLVRKARSALLSLLAATAPVWIPVVAVLFLGYTAYMILFGIPLSAAEDHVDKTTQVQAFLGTTEDKNLPVDEQLLDKYKSIADTWSDGLTQEQKSQVMVYKFPWSVLAATDRVVNDEAVWEGKSDVKPNPEAVFAALRPKFAWKDSTITTTTVTVSTDDKGNRTYSSSTSIQPVSLVTAADTFEGHFEYVYEWQTTTTPQPDGGSVTVTKEVVKQVEQPTEYYKPWKEYLASSRGISNEADFELLENLAMTYDSEYMFFYAFQGGQNIKTYPTYVLAYADVVQQVLSRHPEVPQPLFLALIAHESGGNWQAVNRNTNGSTDAGLCQINSINWPAYGLTTDPFNVSRNLEAGASILGGAIDAYRDITQALYAYNAGTPQNGLKYNPSYAPSVLGLLSQLQSAQARAVAIPATGNQPLTIVAAEQNRQTFVNPEKITVVNERTGERTTVERTPGDGTMWAREAWVYHPALKDVQKGDTLNVQFHDGKNTETKIN